jgi:hypothetical protein
MYNPRKANTSGNTNRSSEMEEGAPLGSVNFEVESQPSMRKHPKIRVRGNVCSIHVFAKWEYAENLTLRWIGANCLPFIQFLGGWK